jgi:hypothetical protein
MSALPPKADIREPIEYVCFVPIADITANRRSMPIDRNGRYDGPARIR